MQRQAAVATGWTYVLKKLVAWWIYCLIPLQLLQTGCDTNLKVKVAPSTQMLSLKSQGGVSLWSGSGTAQDPFVFEVVEGAGTGDIWFSLLERIEKNATLECSDIPAWVVPDLGNLHLVLDAKQAHVGTNYKFSCEILKATVTDINHVKLHFVATVKDVNYAPKLEVAANTDIANLQGSGSKSAPYRFALKRGLESATFEFKGSDHDGDTLQLTCVDMPEFLSIDEVNHKISLAPQAEVPLGIYDFHCSLSDGQTVSDDLLYFSTTIEPFKKAQSYKVAVVSGGADFSLGTTSVLTLEIRDDQGKRIQSKLSDSLKILTRKPGFVQSVDVGFGDGAYAATNSIEAIAFEKGLITIQFGASAVGTFAVEFSGEEGWTVPPPIKINATESTQPPSAKKLLFKTQPTNVVAGANFGSSLEVMFVDDQDNLVVSATDAVTLQLGQSPVGATLSGTTTVVAVNGVATFPGITIAEVGAPFTLVATSGSLTSATSVAFSVTSGVATKLGFNGQPANSVSMVAIAPGMTVEILDASGNRVSTATDTVTLAIGNNAGSSTLGGTLSVAAVAGVATFSDITFDKAGTGYTLNATSGSLASANSSAFDITPAAASKLEFIVQPTSAVAGAAISAAVQVSILDAQDNLVTSATDNIVLAIANNPGSATLGGTLTVAATGGVATFSNITLNKVGTGYTLTAAATGLTGATSASFAITPAAASKLAFSVEPSDAAAGAAVNPAVKVRILDAQDNLVASATDNIIIAIGTNPGTSTLSGTATVSAAAGEATFSNLSLNKSGTGYTLGATATGLTAATSATFNITPGAPDHLAISVQPSTVTHGVAINPAVQVQVLDAEGNLCTGAANSISFAIGTNPGSSTLSGTTSVAASSGVASFSTLSLNNVATGYDLVATATGLTSATTNAFNVTNASPVVSDVTDKSTNEDTDTAAIAFTITDSDSTLSCATSVALTSSNTAVVANGAVTFGGTAPNCTATITPVANANGTTTITLTATDDFSATGTDTFVLTVNAVNDQPTITDIGNQTVAASAVLSGLAFSVDEGGGTFEDAQTLTVTATSSDESIIPSSNITVNYTDNGASSASALSPTIAIEPIGGMYGTVTITVVVDDGQGANNTAQDTFDVTVSQSSETALGTWNFDIGDIGDGNVYNYTTELTYASGKIAATDQRGGGINDAGLNEHWTPQWSSIVAYWPFDNSGAEATAKGYTATLSTGASYTTAGRVGTHALELHSVSEYASAASANPLNLAGNFTISFWVKPDTLSNSGYPIFLSKRDAFAGFTWQVFHQGTNEIRFQRRNASETENLIFDGAGVKIQTGAWNHVIITLNGSLYSLYLNGVLRATESNATTGKATDTDTLYFGNVGEHDGGIDGALDEVAFWSVPLSTTEVQQVFDYQKLAYKTQQVSSIYDASTTQSWTSLDWQTSLPFGKELPDNGASESSGDYAALVGSTGSTSDNDLMANIWALWHFNESSTTAGTYNDLLDTSGNGHHGEVVNGVTLNASGQFGGGIDFGGANKYVDFGDIWDAERSTPFTISSWIYLTSYASHSFLMSDLAGGAPYRGTDIAILASSGYVRFFMQTSDDTQVFVDTTSAIPLNRWVHFTATYDGSSTVGGLKVYFDSVEASTTTSGTILTGSLQVANSLWVGRRNGTSTYFNGMIDEMAIWKRKLHAAEIQQLYQRGANRVKLQFRTCDDVACSGESWKGPDNTSSTYFTELNNNSVPQAMTGNVLSGLPTMAFSSFSPNPAAANRYFQYRTVLESDSATYFPDVRRVGFSPNATDTAPSISPNTTGPTFGSLSSITATYGAGGCPNGAKFQISPDNGSNYYYWTGSYWDWSMKRDGTEANTVAELNANLATFAATLGISDSNPGQFRFQAYLASHALSGESCELDAVAVNGTIVQSGTASGEKVKGSSYNDQLYGAGGDDTLEGGYGNDVLVGGDGVDTLRGGPGADHFGWTASSESGAGVGNRDVVLDFSKADGDKLDLSGITQQIYVLGQDGAFSASGQAELIWVTYNTAADSPDVNEAVVSIDLSGNGSADFEIELRDFDYTTLNISDFVFKNVVGLTAADTIHGSSSNDTLVGGYDGDTINGGAGDDFIYADFQVFSLPQGANIAMWHDASDSSKVIKNTNGTVSEWKDKSAAAFDFIQTNQTKAPTVVSGIGGRNALKFDGVDDLMYRTSVIGSAVASADQVSIFLVYKHIGPSENSSIINYDGYNLNVHGLWGTGFYFDFSNQPAGRLSATPSGFYDNWHLVHLSRKSDTTGFINIDGTNITIGNQTLAFDTGANSTFYLASYMGGDNMRVELSEILIHKVSLSNGDTDLIRNYISQKFGISIGLTFGTDTLTGGPGADTFAWTNASHSSTGSGNRDIITDFNKTEGDKISLTGFSEQIRVIGTAAFAGDGYTELRWANLSDNGGAAAAETLVQIDWGGDGTADFEIEVRDFDYTTLDISDFIFSNALGMTVADTINGSSGNDTLVGGYGGDTINGGAGDDTLIFDSAGINLSELGNLSNHYDATNIAGDGSLFTDGSSIATLKDISGQGHDAPATSGTAVINHNGINGMQALTFLNDEYLTSNTLTPTYGNSTFTVARMADNPAGSDFIYSLQASSLNRYYLSQNGSVLGNNCQASRTTNDDVARIYTVTDDGQATTTNSISLNGDAETTCTTPQINSSLGLKIGRFNSNEFLDGEIGELIHFTNKLSNSNLAMINQYLSNKWQLELSGLSFGSDVLTGGSGADTFKVTQGTYSPSTARDRITDFSQGEGDKIDFSDFPGSAYFGGSGGTSSLVVGSKVVTYAYSAGDTIVYFDSDGDGTAEIELVLTGNIALTGSDFSGISAALPQTLLGTTGADILNGGLGADTITGGYGGDTINGGAGDDVIYPDNVVFVQSSVNNLDLWLDATKSPSMSQDSIGRISQWQDLSSQGHTAVQPVGGNQPILKNSLIGGRSTIEFDGANDSLYLNGVSDYRQYHTVILIGEVYAASTAYDSFYGQGGAGAGNFLVHIGATGGQGIGITQPSQNLGNDSTPQTSPIILDVTANNYTYAINSSFGNSLSGITLTNTTGTASTLAIGASYGSGNGMVDYLKLRVSEFMLYSSNLSSSDLDTIKQYYSLKYGINIGLTIGTDTLTGGAGADTFTWTNASHSGVGSGNRDIITDFSQADGDKIALTGFSEQIRVIGTSAFSSDGLTEMRWYNDSGDAVVAIDWGGDGSADFEIQLTGVTHTNLSISDFLFSNVVGTTGVDVITGTGDNDSLVGGYDGDTLVGGAGDDHLYPDGNFVPSSLAGAIFWYDGSDVLGDGTVTSSGSTITSWVNKVAGGIGDAAAGVGDAPSYQFNDTWGVRFQTGKFIDTPSPGITGTSSFTLATAARVTSYTNEVTSSDGTYLFDRTNSSGMPLLGIKAVGDSWSYQHRLSNGSELGSFSSSTSIDTTGVELITSQRVVGTQRRIWIDNILTGSEADSGGSMVPDPLRIGRHAANGSSGDFLIADFIGYAKALNTTELGDLNRYLSLKHGKLLSGLSFGADTLTGDSGADTFHFNPGTYSPQGSEDQITDFNQGEGDKIDLSDFPGTMTFRSGGAGPSDFSGAVRQVAYSNDGTDTTVFVDSDGDGAAELEIILLNFTGTLTASDFVL